MVVVALQAQRQPMAAAAAVVRTNAQWQLWLAQRLSPSGRVVRVALLAQMARQALRLFLDRSQFQVVAVAWQTAQALLAALLAATDFAARQQRHGHLVLAD